LISAVSVFSQESDFQSWYSLAVKKKGVHKIDMTLKSGLRLRENSSLYSKRFFDVKFKKRLNKQFSIVGGFRYITSWNKQNKISKSRRFYSDLNYKNRLIKRLAYSIRNRLQSQGDIYSEKTTFRQKISLAYNIRKTKLTPNIATEYFLNAEGMFNKLRSTFSVAYPISKNLDVDFAYRIQQEFYANNPETLFIFEGKILYDL
jgi:hypothetical protein